MPKHKSEFSGRRLFGRQLESKGYLLKTEIHSYLHKHPLKLIRKGDDERIKCDGCQDGDVPSGMIYGCRPCLFFLHVSCTERLESTEILCHPCINLMPRISPRFSCDLCGQSREGFSYHCARCSFKADVECATKPEKQLLHFSHPHPLSLHSRISAIYEYRWCNFCQQKNDGLAYNCDSCAFRMHLFCTLRLERKIQHASHPCSLTLDHCESYKCEACKEDCEGFAFRCRKCDFSLCGACYMMPVIRRRTSIDHDEIEKIQQCEFKRHLMTLREINPEAIFGELLCGLCQELCSGPTYVCRRLGFFHESCLLLPQQIDNRYHNGRNLLLSLEEEKARGEDCEVCDGDCYPFAYCCKAGKSSVTLDVRCALQTPTIKWSCHYHLLDVVNSSRRRVRLGSFRDKPTEIICKRCRIPFVVGSYPMIRCFICDYDTHLLCGPLPCTIKHRCHIHPLTLMDYVIDEDRDEFCCHVCEEHRDPDLCVYYCLDCRFVAEVDCVISEVMASLRGQRGKVKLRTTGRRTKCELIIKDLNAKENLGEANRHVLSFQDTICSISNVDQDQWHLVVRSVGMAKKGAAQDSLETKEGVDVRSYLKAGYKSLKADYVPNGNPSECISSFFETYKDEEFVVRGNYFVAETLVPSFECLLAKYGDFAAKSELNPVVKSMCLLVLLDYMQKLRRTLVENKGATKEKVEDYNMYQKFTEYAGFETLFIQDYIDRMTRIRSILRVEKEIDDASLCLGDDILRISEKIQVLSEKKESAIREFEETKRSATAKAEKLGIRDVLTMRMNDRGRGFLL